MHFPSFPLFTLEAADLKVVAGGGGGDEKYGKENGILVFDYKLLPLAYYKTEDVIRDVQTCESLSLTALVIADEQSADREVQGDAGVRTNEPQASSEVVLDKEETNSGALLESKLESSSRDEVANFAGEASITKPAGEAERTMPLHYRTQDDVLMRPLYICAAGLRNLYLLKLEHLQFELLYKIEIKVSFLCFGPELHFVSQKKLFALVESTGTDGDKYELKSYSKDDCHSFYLKDAQINLVYDTSSSFHFYFNNIKNTVKSLKGVLYNPQSKNLIFYHDNFVSVGDKRFDITRITCVKTRRDKVVVGTGCGLVYVIKNRKIAKKMKFDDFPVTSVDVDNKDMLFYSTLVGAVGKAMIRRPKMHYLALLFVLLLAVAVAAKYVR